MENTEMTVAMLMRKNADQFNKQQEEETRKRHEDFVEETIMPNIEKTAAAGCYSVGFTVCTRYSTKLVQTILCELGFTVEKSSPTSRTLAVYW